jgi:hypothetical protein
VRLISCRSAAVETLGIVDNVCQSVEAAVVTAA